MNIARARIAVLSASLLLAAGAANASGGNTYDVVITNITKAQVFSPPVLVSHDASIAVFQVGAPALPELAIVAEDGAGKPLADLLNTLPAVGRADYTMAPIPPGASAAYEVYVPTTQGSGRGKGRGNDAVLSIVSMLVNTNDAFLALDSEELPQGHGDTVTYYVGAFDAGSEANNEDCAFVPGPACPPDSGNARATDGAEGFVYIHNGIHGIADLGPAAYDWRNPVAKITITRTR
jgi:hypothetical protein